MSSHPPTRVRLEGVSPSLLARRPLPSYFVLACVITWALVLPLALAENGLLARTVPEIWHATGALGPILAAFVVTLASEGRTGAHRLWRKMTDWRIGSLWLCVAMLSPVAIFGAALVIAFVGGAGWPDWGKLRLGWAWTGGQLLASVAYGFGEEPGWRGFALPKLQERRGALRATTLLTLGWGIWHIPAFFYRYHLSGPGDIVGFFIGLYAGAIFLTFLYNSTGGSLFAVIAWHVVWNAVNQVAMVVSTPTLAIMSGLVMVAALGVVWHWGPTLSTLKPGQHNLMAIEEAAADFLDKKRIAVTGVSRNAASHSSNTVYQRLRERKYQVFAVNPNAEQVEGDRCFHDLKSIPGGVEAVVIGTRPERAMGTLQECAELGIKHVWMHRAFGTGSVSETAAVWGRAHGIRVIDGGCPLMFEPTSDAGHKFMCSILTWVGNVPRRVS